MKVIFGIMYLIWRVLRWTGLLILGLIIFFLRWMHRKTENI